MNRTLTWSAALTGAAALVIWQFGDRIVELLTPERVAWLVNGTWQLFVIIVIGIGAIGIGWTTTEVFKRGVYDPDEWGTGPVKRRLMLCSFVWTSLANFTMLSLRFIYEAPLRHIAEVLLYIGGETIVVAGIGLVSYNVVVNLLWRSVLRHFWPTKWVQTPSGIEERLADEPSDPDTEKTIVTKPRDPPK